MFSFESCASGWRALWSSMSCESRSAHASPAGPPPTMTTSAGISGCSILCRGLRKMSILRLAFSSWLEPYDHGQSVRASTRRKLSMIIADLVERTSAKPIRPGTFRVPRVSVATMRRNWPLRQLLAILRGIALTVFVFLSLIFLQLVPSPVRGGFSGVRNHIARVAIAGVPPGHQGIAVLRMYEALASIVLLVCILFLAQRYLGRKLASDRRSLGRTAQ